MSSFSKFCTKIGVSWILKVNLGPTLSFCAISLKGTLMQI